MQTVEKQPAGKTALYRHFDADHSLLYVGISLNAISRLEQHKAASWSGDIASVEIEYFQTRQEAADAERQAIKAERPRWNIIHAKPQRSHAVECRLPVVHIEPDEPALNIESLELSIWWENGQRCSKWTGLDKISSI